MHIEKFLKTISYQGVFFLFVDTFYNTSDRNNLRIVGVQQGKAQVRLYNILGKKVLNNSFIANGINEVTLPNIKTGIYIVQLETENGTLNRKVIIK